VAPFGLAWRPLVQRSVVCSAEPGQAVLCPGSDRRGKDADELLAKIRPLKNCATRQGPGRTLNAVASDEHTLLHNLLDSLDRLYDRDCGPDDVDLLLTATASAITDRSWIASIEQASGALRDLIRSRLPAEEEYRTALIVTNDLRIKLADYYK
jgi:hypothetical protein